MPGYDSMHASGWIWENTQTLRIKGECIAQNNSGFVSAAADEMASIVGAAGHAGRNRFLIREQQRNDDRPEGRLAGARGPLCGGAKFLGVVRVTSGLCESR